MHLSSVMKVELAQELKANISDLSVSFLLLVGWD